MVSKCLNSCCSATFRYLGKGRLYCIDFADLSKRNVLAGKRTVTTIRSKAWPIEYFWLCERCATTMTIELSDAGELRLAPVEASAGSAAPQKRTAQSVRAATIRSGETVGDSGKGTGCDLPGTAAG